MNNNKWTIIVSSLILALGFVCLGVQLKTGIKEFREGDRVVTVRGLSERTVQADNVLWPLQYKIIGNDLNTIYATMEQNNNKIIDFLKSNGIAEADISVALPEVIDLYAERYVNTNDVRSRYNITATVTVTSTNITQVLKAMNNTSTLLKDGLAISFSEYGNNAIVFSFKGLNNIKPEMIKEATESAREAAKKFAEDSDSKLGKIKSASQGQFSITDPDKNAPYIKQVRVVTSVEYFLKD